jgi:N-dimethylarginine dimethylaminohydrolase
METAMVNTTKRWWLWGGESWLWGGESWLWGGESFETNTHPARQRASMLVRKSQVSIATLTKSSV